MLSPLLQRLLTPGRMLGASLVLLMVFVIFLSPIYFPSPLWIRLTIATAIALTWAAVRLIQFLRRRRASEAAVNTMRQQDNEAQGSMVPSKRGHLVEVRERFDEALRFVSAGTLYAKPWFIVAGPSGSGKSEALRRSGLHFEGDHAGQQVKGIGGTRLCQWWFAEHAVFLDTTGRWIRAEAETPEDAEQWLEFLDMLKEGRPNLPASGLLLVISVDNFLGSQQEEIDAIANRLRLRIEQLIDRLGVVFPVYLLLSKCDLIAGFRETFDTLSDERAESRWAVHFRSPSTMYSMERAFDEEFGKLIDRLRRNRWLVEYQAVQRMTSLDRALDAGEAFALPYQIEALKERLGPFLATLFKPSAYGHDTPWLRGLYLTSSMQEGAPIDFLAPLSAQETSTTPRSSRPYFLKTLFREDLTQSDHLVRPSQKVIRTRRRLRRWAFTAALGAFSVGVMLMFLGFRDGRSQLEALANATQQADQLRINNPIGVDNNTTISRLDVLLDQIESTGNKTRGAWPIIYLGLFRPQSALDEAQRVYTQAFFKVYLERNILERLRRFSDQRYPSDNQVMEAWLTYIATQYILDPDRLTAASTKHANFAIDHRPDGPLVRHIRFLTEHRELLRFAKQELVKGMETSLAEEVGDLHGIKTRVDTRWNPEAVYDSIIHEAFAGGETPVFEAIRQPNCYLPKFVPHYLSLVNDYAKRSKQCAVWSADQPKRLEEEVLLDTYASNYVSSVANLLDQYSYDQDASNASDPVQRALSFLEAARRTTLPWAVQDSTLADSLLARTISESTASLTEFLDNQGSITREQYEKLCKDVTDPDGPEALSQFLAPLGDGNRVSNSLQRVLAGAGKVAVGMEQTSQTQAITQQLRNSWSGVALAFESLGHRFPFDPSSQKVVDTDTFDSFFNPQSGQLHMFFQNNLARWYRADFQYLPTPDKFPPTIPQRIRDCYRAAKSIQEAFYVGAQLKIRFQVHSPSIELSGSCGGHYESRFDFDEESVSYVANAPPPLGQWWQWDGTPHSARIKCMQATQPFAEFSSSWAVLQCIQRMNDQSGLYDVNQRLEHESVIGGCNVTCSWALRFETNNINPLAAAHRFSIPKTW